MKRGDLFFRRRGGRAPAIAHEFLKVGPFNAVITTAALMVPRCVFVGEIQMRH